MAYDLLYPARSLILRGNGTNGSTTFTDDSQRTKTASVAGSGVQISTAQSKFGGASLSFPGSGHLAYSGHEDFQFDGDVIVDGWFRHNIGTAGDFAMAVLGSFDGADNSAMLYISGYQIRAYFNSMGPTTSIASGIYPDAGGWYHVELSRTGGVWRLFVDGVLRGSLTNAGALETGFVGIGGGSEMGRWNGYLDDFRISKGIPGHVENFAVPDEEVGTEAPMVYAQAELTAPSRDILAAFGTKAPLGAPGRSMAMVFGRPWMLTAPVPRLLMTLRRDDSIAALTAPGRALDMRWGSSLRAVAPVRVLAMAGSTMGSLSMSLAAPGHGLAMSATISGQMSADITAPGRSLAASFGGRLFAAAPRATVLLDVRTGTLMALTLIAPRPRMQAEISAAGRGMVFELVAPRARLLPALRMDLTAPRWAFTMEVVEAVEVAYDCFVLNLRSQGDGPAELTRYTNWPFDKVFRLGDEYFAVADDGIYRLGGETDHAVPEPIDVAWAWRTALSDFGEPAVKTVPTVYFSGRLGRSMDVAWQVGEKEDTVYRYRSRRDATAQNYREKLGRGLKARYFAVGADGEGEFELDTLDFEVHTLSRRI